MHLLNTTGSALTECSLMAARREELTVDPTKATCEGCQAALIRQGICPACGGKKLIWAYSRARWKFYLACEECAETLINSVDVDQIATFLSAQRWRP